MTLSILDRLRAKRVVVPATAPPFASLTKRNPVIERELREWQAEEGLEGLADAEQWRTVDWPRITGLPAREVVRPEDVDQLSKREVEARAYAQGFRLFAEQLDALRQYDETGGLLAQIAVGGGKTIICAAIASRAYVRKVDRILLLIPAQVYSQFTQVDLPWIRPRVPLRCPFYPMRGLSKAMRLRRAQGANGCYILPYSLLSTPDARDLIEAIKPKLIIADEAHYLRHRDSARTKRILDYLDKHPECRLVAMSGTLTSKSIMDYHHLARHALRECSPLPKQVVHATLWASVLDGEQLQSVDRAKQLAPLVTWAREQRGLDLAYIHQGYRQAYRERVATAPGVVMTQGDSLGVSLIVAPRDPGEPGPILMEKMDDVRRCWIAPNGDEIAHAMHQYKWLYELTAGFYYDLVWPAPADHARRRGITEAQAEAAIRAAKEHHAANQEYQKVLREFLRTTSRPGLDTPMLVGRACAQRPELVPAMLVAHWREVHELEFPGMPERYQVPTRLDDYKLRAALGWAQEHKRGIIWCYHNEVLRWTYELLEAAGLDPLLADAGELGNRAIVEPTAGSRLVVASVKAHGIGKNLQHFQDQLFLQWVRPAPDAEQAIGRTHRTGQKADELVVEILMGPEFDHQLYSATLVDALYIEQTTGNKQKVLYASYETRPRIYSVSVLNRLGFQTQPASLATQQKLEDRFATKARE